MREMTAGKKRFVKRKLREQRPTIRIGKNKDSLGVINEVNKQLDKNKMVKVKILSTALVESKAKEVALRIAEQTESSLVEVKGHTFLLYKPRNK